MNAITFAVMVLTLTLVFVLFVFLAPIAMELGSIVADSLANRLERKGN